MSSRVTSSLGRMVSRARRVGIPVIALCVLFAPNSFALVSCEEVGGVPGEEITIRLEIDRPLPDEIVVVQDACTETIEVEGVFSVTGVGGDFYDFYIILDASGSAFIGLSGADVNNNGSVTDIPGDSIYHAEISAAQLFIEELNPTFHRVAVMTFNDSVAVVHQLSNDFSAAYDACEALKGGFVFGGTNYTAALNGIRDHAVAFGDFTKRQFGLFLSDGEPNDDAASIRAAALELDALGIVTDTFALGPLPGGGLELQDIAATTGGDFHALASPGDILTILPTLGVLEPPFSFTWFNDNTGDRGDVAHDREAGTFSTRVELSAGRNQIRLFIEAPGAPPTLLDCLVEVWLEPEPAPANIGAALRVTRSGPERENLSLIWPSAPLLGPIESDLVLTSTDVRGSFVTEVSELLDARHERPLPPGALVFYDVRRANCVLLISED